MIINDCHHIPGLDLITDSITGSIRFEGHGVRLDVLLANRTRLEEQTGTDLIYYNATYKSFVMIQYKAMDGQDDDGAIYRLPNPQLSEEIRRMDALAASLRVASRPSNRDGYRISDSPFYLKICPRIVLNPDSVELTPGMYFSREHFSFLETDPDMVGPEGGRKITYRNVRRYLNNTDFVGLVRKAWIGTTPDQSSLLEPMIQEILTEGRAAVIAVKTDVEPTVESFE
jgi:hypothetical protein